MIYPKVFCLKPNGGKSSCLYIRFASTKTTAYLAYSAIPLCLQSTHETAISTYIWSIIFLILYRTFLNKKYTVYQIIFHQIQRLDCSLYVQTIHQRVSLYTAHATQGVAECDTVHWVGTGLLLGEWRNHWFYAPLNDSTSGTSRLIDFGGWITSCFSEGFDSTWPG